MAQGRRGIIWEGKCSLSGTSETDLTGPLSGVEMHEAAIDAVSIASSGSPTLTLRVERQDGFGNWLSVATVGPTDISSANTQMQASIGSGLSANYNLCFGGNFRVTGQLSGGSASFNLTVQVK